MTESSHNELNQAEQHEAASPSEDTVTETLIADPNAEPFEMGPLGTVVSVEVTRPAPSPRKEKRPARKTVLSIGLSFETATVKKIANRIPRGIAIVVEHNGKEAFGALKEYLIAGATPEAKSARLKRIESGAEAVPAVTVFEINEHGADFIETSFIQDKKRQERGRALRLLRESTWAEAKAAVESQAPFEASITRGGVKKYGVFVTWLTRESTLKDGTTVKFSLDGMVHCDVLHGGESSMQDRQEGDKLTVRVLSAVPKQKLDKRTGQERLVLEVSLAEVVNFDMLPGDTLRGARFVEEDSVDGVSVAIVDWNGFRCLLPESELGGTKVESLKKSGTSTHVKFVRQDASGKIWVTKKDAK